MGEIASSPREESSGQPVGGPYGAPEEQSAAPRSTAQDPTAPPAPQPTGGATAVQRVPDVDETARPTDGAPAGTPEERPLAEEAAGAASVAGQPVLQEPVAGESEAERVAAARRAADAQAAADLAAVRQWAAQRAAAERAAAERASAAPAATDEAEAERARAEQAAADLAAVREWAAARAADEKAAAEREAAERAAAHQAEVERLAAAAAMAAERLAIQQEAARQRAAAVAAERQAEAERAAAKRADVERAHAQWAAAAAQQAAGRTPAAPPAAGTATTTTANRGRRRAAAAGGRGKRLASVLAFALLVLVVVAGVLLGLRLTGSGASTTVAEQVPDAVLPELRDPGPVLSELAADAPVPTPAGVAAALTPLLADPALGGGLSAQVVDVASGQVLFDRDATDPSTPASTAKLLTGLAALTTMDPTDRLTTTVVAGAVPGEVVLVGGGDPTLSTTDPSQSYPGAATVADLAAQVQRALAGQPVTRVVIDNSLFAGPLTATGWGPGDAPSTYAAPVSATAVDGARVTPGQDQRSGSPGTDAGKVLATALGAPDAVVELGEAPAGARTLGTVQSAPVIRLVEQALTASDNLLAESLARHVAIARGLPATFEGAADGITAALAEAGLDTTGLTLSDGSGLSQDDRVPARLLVDVLRAAADGSVPGAADLLTGLPVAGYDGTLADRAVTDGAGAPGSVRAKTGTLQGVNDLAGTVLTADGRLLAFAVMADGTVGALTVGEGALDQVADALAGCGCR